MAQITQMAGARAAIARRIERTRVRLRGRGRGVETQRDLQKLLDAAVVEQAIFFRAISAALLDQALSSFRQGVQFIARPSDPSWRAMSALADRIAQLLAAAQLLGAFQVRRDADLPLRKSVQSAASVDLFFGELDQVGPARAVEYLRRLTPMTRTQWEQAAAAQRARAFTIAGVNQQAALEGMRELIAHSLESGLTPKQFMEKAQDLLRNFETTAGKLRTLWNTNVGQALADGRREELADPDVRAVVPFRLFDAMLDQFVRPNHALLEGAIAPADWWDGPGADLQPLLGFNCLLPGNVVQGNFVGALKTFYSGPAIEIRTLHGNAVTITGNHPVLTSRGWIPAKEINEGDYVLRYVEPTRLLIGPNQDEEHAPTSIEDLFEAFNPEAGRSFEVTPLELHKDALFTEGKVHVVSADRELLNEPKDTPASQDTRQFSLSRSNQGLIPVAAECAPRDSFFRVNAPQPRHPGLSQLAVQRRDIFPVAQSGPFQGFSLRLAARFDPLTLQCANDGGAADAEILGEFFDADTGPVFGDQFARIADFSAAWGLKPKAVGSVAHLDIVATEKPRERTPAHVEFLLQLTERGAGAITFERVSEIRKFEWRGHVYDAETTTSWMVANGLVISNCRCVLLGITAARARKLLEQGEPYFGIAEQGVPLGAGPDASFRRAA